MSEEVKNISETVSAEEEARMINVSKNRVVFKVHFSVFFGGELDCLGVMVHLV